MDYITGFCSSVASGVRSLFTTSSSQAVATIVAVSALNAARCEEVQSSIDRESSVIPSSMSLTPARRAAVEGPSLREVSLREGALPEIRTELRASVMRYMRGEAGAEVGITPDNYREVLQAVKVIDLELDRTRGSRSGLQNSTYELRTRCLIASRGTITSVEAYTKSIDPANYRDPFSARTRAYAGQTENYVPERIRIHSRVLQKYVVDCLALSQRLDTTRPTMFALRGNCGSGKTFMSTNDPELQRGMNERGEAQGTLAPDAVKAQLVRNVDGVTSEQIHIEGCELHRRIMQELQQRARGTTLVRDQIFESTGHVADLITSARASGRDLVIRDLEVPLALSALRVLGRNVNNEPCMSLEHIINGFRIIRRDRREALNLIVASPEVRSYELHVTQRNGRKGIAARKIPATPTTPARLEILDRELFEYAVSEDGAEREIQELQNARINRNFYRSFISCGIKVDRLRLFLGMTVEEALQRHATTLPRRASVG